MDGRDDDDDGLVGLVGGFWDIPIIIITSFMIPCIAVHFAIGRIFAHYNYNFSSMLLVILLHILQRHLHSTPLLVQSSNIHGYLLC